MKINRLEKLKEYKPYWDVSEFDEYDLKHIPKEVEEIRYWYTHADYEGSGQMIWRIWEKYILHNCWHCSCYWPTDEIEYKTTQSLDEIEKSLSGEYRREVIELIEFVINSK